jgi:hypothetical protein
VRQALTFWNFEQGAGSHPSFSKPANFLSHHKILIDRKMQGMRVGDYKYSPPPDMAFSGLKDHNRLLAVIDDT